MAGLRWHCRDNATCWPRRPGTRPARPRAGFGPLTEHPLRDALRLLEYLVDACEA